MTPDEAVTQSRGSDPLLVDRADEPVVRAEIEATQNPIPLLRVGDEQQGKFVRRVRGA